jgi:hypothetical protein
MFPLENALPRLNQTDVIFVAPYFSMASGIEVMIEATMEYSWIGLLQKGGRFVREHAQ